MRHRILILMAIATVILASLVSTPPASSQALAAESSCDQPIANPGWASMSQPNSCDDTPAATPDQSPDEPPSSSPSVPSPEPTSSSEAESNVESGDQPWVGFCDDMTSKSSDSDLHCTALTQAASSLDLLNNVAQSGENQDCSDIAAAFGACNNDSDQWRPYQLTFALGLVIALIALLATVVKAADGTNVHAISLLAASGTRTWLYYPLMLLAPWVVVSVQDVASQTGDALLNQAGLTLLSSMVSKMTGVFTSDGGFGSAVQLILGGFGTNLLLLIALIVVAVGTIIELTIADFATYLILCLLPVGIALSIYPRWRRIGASLIGALLGVILIKPAIGLALWAFADRINALGSAETWRQWVALLVALVMSMAVGSLAPMVLSKIMPSVADGVGSMRAAGTHGRQMVQHGASTTKNVIEHSYRGAKAARNTDAAIRGAKTAKEAAAIQAQTGGSMNAAYAAGGPAGVAAAVVLATARTAAKVPGKVADRFRQQQTPTASPQWTPDRTHGDVESQPAARQPLPAPAPRPPDTRREPMDLPQVYQPPIDMPQMNQPQASQPKIPIPQPARRPDGA